MKSIPFPTLAFLAIFQADAYAHHSGSNYDRTVQASIQGTIVRYDWSNPHVYLWVEEETDSGERVTWEIEGFPPAILRRLGWNRDEVNVGDRVTVGGNPGRDPEQGILMMTSLAKSGDTEFSMRPRHMMTSLAQEGTQSGELASGLAGTWITLLDPQASGTFRPRAAATARGREAIGSYVEEVDSPALECVPFAAPVTMMAPDIKSIEVSDDVVLIRGEFDASMRTVYLNLDSHDGAAESVQGHSIGHWEGDNRTLVIDTAHFTPQRAIMIGLGLPSGSDKHLVERLELNEEGTHLTYSFELEDPEYLEGPIKVDGMQWVYRADLKFEDLPCNLDNARRFVN